MKNKTLGIIISLTVIAVIGGFSISYQAFQPEKIIATQEINTTDLENSKIRGPGDLYLLDYGNEISSDAVKSIPIFAKVSTPSNVLGNLELTSLRIRDYAESQMMTLFYVPLTTTLQDNDTFTKVMENNGIIIIITEEKQSPTYDPQKWRESFVNAAPQVRKIDTINNYPTIVITGNPAKYIKSEVLIYKDNLQIDIVSVKHNAQALVGIAQLITEG